MKIFKIQLPIYSDTQKQALIYSKDKKELIFLDITKEIENLMGGELKKYFYAEIQGGHLYIDREANKQDW